MLRRGDERRSRSCGTLSVTIHLTHKSTHKCAEGGIIEGDEDIDGTAIVFRGLTNETMELLVTVGLISSISTRWPDDVQVSWIERIMAIRNYVRQQVAEAEEFASSYD